ncbi:hypothetical protein MRB53_016414 [Persea americana]|uniref:Uncharacterized protein n=1 Tax=Persea americana TaxID=3435 RepID=A0ACC2M257_PERAE|nr:hypothetical protein MRB53_016414 [Persea americana]
MWFLSVIYEIWFAILGILNQFPKCLSIDGDTYLDTLSLRYEKGSQPSQLSLVDIFVITVDSLKEPVTNAILSILVVDYSIDKVSCYIFYEGAAMLTLEALSETSDFTRKWVPFCKKFNDDQVAPEWYFAHKMDYLKDMVLTSFGKGRRAMKRGFGMLQKAIVWSCRCIGAKLN